MQSTTETKEVGFNTCHGKFLIESSNWGEKIAMYELSFPKILFTVFKCHRNANTLQTN